MMSYAVVDRDRERLVEDLDIARQIEPTPVYRRKVDRRHWFRLATSPAILSPWTTASTAAGMAILTN